MQKIEPTEYIGRYSMAIPYHPRRRRRDRSHVPAKCLKKEYRDLHTFIPTAKDSHGRTHVTGPRQRTEGAPSLKEFARRKASFGDKNAADWLAHKGLSIPKRRKGGITDGESADA